MNEAAARPYFQQIMYALVSCHKHSIQPMGQPVDPMQAYSHSLRVVHRDLKPENILLAEGSTQRNGLKVKIGDFGLSNQWSDGDWLKTGCGTRTLTTTPFVPLIAHLAPSIAHYAAPEIIQGQLYGVEVDVWSCGAILYAFA